MRFTILLGCLLVAHALAPVTTVEFAKVEYIEFALVILMVMDVLELISRIRK